MRYFPLLFPSLRYFPICSMRYFPYFSYLWDISTICSMIYSPLLFPSMRYFPHFPIFEIFPHLFYEMFSPTFHVYEIFLPSVLWNISPTFPIYKIFPHLFYEMFSLHFPSVKYFSRLFYEIFPLLFPSMRYMCISLVFEILPFLPVSAAELVPDLGTSSLPL